jgi:hypothetical protein
MANNYKILNNLETLLISKRDYVLRPSQGLVLLRSVSGVVKYYPAFDQWRCCGELYHGDANDLLAWMDKQENNK